MLQLTIISVLRRLGIPVCVCVCVCACVLHTVHQCVFRDAYIIYIYIYIYVILCDDNILLCRSCFLFCCLFSLPGSITRSKPSFTASKFVPFIAAPFLPLARYDRANNHKKQHTTTSAFRASPFSRSRPRLSGCFKMKRREMPKARIASCRLCSMHGGCRS